MSDCSSLPDTAAELSQQLPRKQGRPKLPTPERPEAHLAAGSLSFCLTHRHPRPAPPVPATEARV